MFVFTLRRERFGKFECECLSDVCETWESLWRSPSFPSKPLLKWQTHKPQHTKATISPSLSSSLSAHHLRDRIRNLPFVPFLQCLSGIYIYMNKCTLWGNNQNFYVYANRCFTRLITHLAKYHPQSTLPLPLLFTLHECMLRACLRTLSSILHEDIPSSLSVTLLNPSLHAIIQSSTTSACFSFSILRNPLSNNDIYIYIW